MPGSHLAGVGDVDWGRGFRPQLHIESSTVGLQDILSWYRALRPDVAEDLRAEGALGVDVTVGGWPIELQHGAIASAGGMLTGKSMPAPLMIGAVNAGSARGGLDFAPTEFSFSSVTPNAGAETDASAADVSSSFVLRGSVFPDRNGAIQWPPHWHFSIEGATPRAQDWLAAARALGHPVNSGWTAGGGFAVKIRAVNHEDSFPVPWLGTMDFLDLTLSPAYVNQPVRVPKAH